MKKLIQSWRWFGPDDPVSLSDARQSGATDIVSALHHIPIGESWSVNAIQAHQSIIADAGLTWSVVESVPIHEDIKRRIGNFQQYIDTYKETIQNLGECGIPVLTYNFMPVVDWTRTDLKYKLEDGALALRFDVTQMNAFDLFIMKRKGAANDYSRSKTLLASQYYFLATEQQKELLTQTITAGLPGSMAAKTNSLDSFKELIDSYEHIDHAKLRQHLLLFLDEIIPVAEKANVKLAIHPDDPPFSLFGLPRVVSVRADFEAIFNHNKSITNGLCFCTGSLGVNPQNNLVDLIELFGNRIHFAHLRSTTREADGSFYEAPHLTGDVDMYEVVKALSNIQQEYKTSIPIRPDHGHVILGDLAKETNPGYSAIGRLKGLAELRGLELGILKSTAQ